MHRVLMLAAIAGTAAIAGCGGSIHADRGSFDEGFSAFQAAQWTRAIDGFTRFLRSDPTSELRGEVYYYRGEALVHLDRRSEGMADFQRAIGAKARQPILAFAEVAIGNLYYEEGNDTRAVEYYGDALKGPQDDLPMDRVMLRLGVSLQRLGEWTQADKYLGHLIERFPDTASAVEARRRVHADSFSVQTGAYAAPSAAQQEADRLRSRGFVPRLGETTRSGQLLHTVQVGRARNYAEAQALAQRLAAAGFAAAIVP